MDKPVNLIIEDLRLNLVNITNESGLPLFVLESIYKDLYNEIHISYLNQIKKDKEDWAKAQEMKEEETE